MFFIDGLKCGKKINVKRPVAWIKGTKSTNPFATIESPISSTFFTLHHFVQYGLLCINPHANKPLAYFGLLC